MSDSAVVLTLKKGAVTTKVAGDRVVFSPHQCFAFDDGVDDINCILAIASHLREQAGLVFMGSKQFVDYFLRHAPDINDHLLCTIVYGSASNPQQNLGLASVVVDIQGIPDAAQTVFICETLEFHRMQIKELLPATVGVIEPTILAEIAPAVIPIRGWAPQQPNIYPINIPRIELRRGLDLAIVDSPSRNLSLMPNGLGYLNNALKKTDVDFQILDLDIISYHRFHVHRLYDLGGSVTLPGDFKLPEDPWQAEHYDLWTTSGGGAKAETGINEVLEFFRPLIDETIEAVIKAQPKVLGLSIQGCNEAAAREIAIGVQAQLPEIIIVVGGFSCYNADIGRRAFPECDYMCIGEADLTVGPLLEALARGERPFNQPGIISRFDTPEYSYIPAPMIHDLDTIEFPKYEWCDLSVYRNFNDYQLTPIIASRGCRWSRCAFCAERFYWRIRTPENFVDELEWLVNKGCHLFMFNESDLGGMPERVEEICDEIIRRGLHLKVRLTGQLRVNKNQTRSFFEKLRAANFVALRFGIDAFSENTLRLQKKGYTVEMIAQNLKDCWEVGIFTEVNWVIGVPGETETDVDEGIQLILDNQDYIGRLANINPLILVNGSVYWIDPESHNIVFKKPKAEIYEQFPRALPADQWYSTEPYIDAQVRKERFEKIVLALDDAGFNVGEWAARIIEDVKLSRDAVRTGNTEGNDTSFGEFDIAGGAERGKSDDLLEGEVAFDSPSLSSPGEEHFDTENVVQLRAAGSLHQEEGKPLAEPPLFGVAGKAPELVRKTDTHNIVFHEGWFYAVPHALADIDLTSAEPSKLAGITRFLKEEEALDALEESAQWANTRGQYDDQQKQRAGGSYMRVDSASAVSELGQLASQSKILQFEGSYFAVEEEALADAFAFSQRIAGGRILRRIAGKLPASMIAQMRSLMRNAFKGKDAASEVWAGVQVKDEKLSLLSVFSKNAVAELICTIDAYNLVKFDAVYYGVPHGASVDWESGALETVPGMLVGTKVNDVVELIKSQFKAPTFASIPEQDNFGTENPVVIEQNFDGPVLMGTMELEGYNIVSYEGWVYGMPHALGDLDLTEVDVIEMPGVIRDVSRDAVESEIISRSIKQRQTA